MGKIPFEFEPRTALGIQQPAVDFPEFLHADPPRHAVRPLGRRRRKLRLTRSGMRVGKDQIRGPQRPRQGTARDHFDVAQRSSDVTPPPGLRGLILPQPRQGRVVLVVLVHEPQEFLKGAAALARDLGPRIVSGLAVSQEEQPLRTDGYQRCR